MFVWLLIYVVGIVGLYWAYHCAQLVLKIEVTAPAGVDHNTQEHYKNLIDIGDKIANGADAFLMAEYRIIGIFICGFGALVFFIVDVSGSPDSGFGFYATFSYLVGSVASMLCGYIGMKIAVQANFRTTFKATESLAEAFRTAYSAGCVMGFSMISISMILLTFMMQVYISLYSPALETDSHRSYAVLMEMLAGYGLGGSTIALFGRVGGGIYTKAADVGADLVGKVEQDLAEDSPRNPATIADNVGDNVGDIAGMGSDLFGSFAESTCAALVFIATTQDLINSPLSLAYPILISAFGILACLATSYYGIYVYIVDTFAKIEEALKYQLVISTVLTLALVHIAAVMTLPDSWNFVYNEEAKVGTPWYATISVSMGLISGLIIGYSTDYYTSNAHYPVQEMAEECSSGPAINIINGLALGYKSNLIPILLLAATAVVSMNLLGLFGVALSAIGMLSTLCVGLAIDAYGPISDNAGGIAEMSEIGADVREKTDALDAAGNTTAAIGKGFAIGSAALVSLALYGAFVTRSMEQALHPVRSIQITNSWIFGSLLVGAMLPYLFSAMTMRSVGKAAKQMVDEVRRQFQNEQIRSGAIPPDYEACIRVSTNQSLKEMIAPGLLVILTPIACGVLLHPVIVAGLLPGALLSGIQLAISMSNTGGAWDNAKKYIESGKLVDKASGVVRAKGTDEHKAAVIGDTVGDPLKDTSGPSLNILVKLMAIISLVFAGGFSRTAYLADILQIR